MMARIRSALRPLLAPLMPNSAAALRSSTAVLALSPVSVRARRLIMTWSLQKWFRSVPVQRDQSTPLEPNLGSPAPGFFLTAYQCIPRTRFVGIAVYLLQCDGRPPDWRAPIVIIPLPIGLLRLVLVLAPDATRVRIECDSSGPPRVQGQDAAPHGRALPLALRQRVAEHLTHRQKVLVRLGERVELVEVGRVLEVGETSLDDVLDAVGARSRHELVPAEPAQPLYLLV